MFSSTDSLLLFSRNDSMPFLGFPSLLPEKKEGTLERDVPIESSSRVDCRIDCAPEAAMCNRIVRHAKSRVTARR